MKGATHVARAAGAASSRAGRPDEGSVIVWALFFMSVVTGLLVAHVWELDASRRALDLQYRRVEHARAFAGSGLTEAIAWLQRQSHQPVTAFAPRLDLDAKPPLRETLNPALGLVREFPVRGELWGRYEVRTAEAVDLSTSRNRPPGSVWDLGARGILFERVDPEKPFDRYPNRLLAVHMVRTEVQTVRLELPAQSAVVIPDLARLQVRPRATIAGGPSSGVTYRDVESAESGGLLGGLFAIVADLLNGLTGVTGSPQAVRMPALDATPERVFGLRSQQLEQLADLRVLDPVWRGEPLAEQLVYAAGDLTVTPQHPLRGSGVVVVSGDLEIAAGTHGDLYGLLVVGGDAKIAGPFRLRGALVVAGGVELGDGVHAVRVEHDPQATGRAREWLGRYRQSGVLRPSGTAGAFTPLAEYLSPSGRARHAAPR